MTTTHGSGTPADPYTRQLPSKVWIIIGGLILLFTIIITLMPPSEMSKLREMSCTELTAEMLKMTGPNATLADYDIDRVRDINQVRNSKDCDNPFLHPEG